MRPFFIRPNYKDHFRGKVVYCNCDDPRVSNFFVHFSRKFHEYGLKKLIATCYKNPNPDLPSKHDSERSVYLEYDGDQNMDAIYPLYGNRPFHGGDFRSSECVEFLKQADIVVTNPPFSLFREYVSQLMEYDKKFLIIGHQNAITYKEIFPLIKENKIWLGYGFKGGAGHFISRYEDYATATDRKEGMIRVSGVHWFTNLQHSKRTEEFTAIDTYFSEKYPHYENYDAIEVSQTRLIPNNWEGAMGVPITFLDKYNPDQFEIIKFRKGDDDKDLRLKPEDFERLKKYRLLPKNSKSLYFRIIIRWKKKG